MIEKDKKATSESVWNKKLQIMKYSWTFYMSRDCRVWQESCHGGSMGAGTQVFTPPSVHPDLAKVANKYLPGISLRRWLQKSRLLRTTLLSPFLK